MRRLQCKKSVSFGRCVVDRRLESISARRHPQGDGSGVFCLLVVHATVLQGFGLLSPIKSRNIDTIHNERTNCGKHSGKFEEDLRLVNRTVFSG